MNFYELYNLLSHKLTGNEGSGLRSQSLQLCDTLVNISSRPDINTFVGSLNVSVATGNNKVLNF